MCASTAKVLLRWCFVVRRGHVEAKFHDFQKIVRWHPTPPRSVVIYPLWFLDAPLMILGWFHDHWFSMISWCWDPRARFSQGLFFDLEGPNGIHGLLTCCSSFPRWHFDGWSHLTTWWPWKACPELTWNLEMWHLGTWAIWRPLPSWRRVLRTMTPRAIWRLLVTWRRVLRTIFKIPENHQWSSQTI